MIENILFLAVNLAVVYTVYWAWNQDEKHLASKEKNNIESK